MVAMTSNSRAKRSLSAVEFVGDAERLRERCPGQTESRTSELALPLPTAVTREVHPAEGRASAAEWTQALCLVSYLKIYRTGQRSSGRAAARIRAASRIPKSSMS